MKRLALIFWLLALLIPSSVLAGSRVEVWTAISETAISAGEEYTSGAKDVKSADGYFAIELTVAGSGTAAVTYQASVDGTNFYTPQDASALMSDKTVGTYYDQVLLEFAPYYRFIITETGGASAITATLKVAIQ